MNDQLLMDNYLLVLKSTVEVYVHGTLESSNSDVREHLKECLDNIMSMQADTYDKMAECGWYQVDNVEETKIQETIVKLQNNSNDDNKEDTEDTEE